MDTSSADVGRDLAEVIGGYPGGLVLADESLLIGSPVGRGKTAMCNIIALHALLARSEDGKFGDAQLWIGD